MIKINDSKPYSKIRKDIKTRNYKIHRITVLKVTDKIEANHKQLNKRISGATYKNYKLEKSATETTILKKCIFII